MKQLQYSPKCHLKHETMRLVQFKMLLMIQNLFSAYMSFLSSTPVVKSMKPNNLKNLFFNNALWHYFGKLHHFTKKTDVDGQRKVFRK